MNRPGLNAGAFLRLGRRIPLTVSRGATHVDSSPHLASKPSSDWVIDCQGNMGRYLPVPAAPTLPSLNWQPNWAFSTGS